MTPKGLLTPELINSTVAAAYPGASGDCVELGDGWITARLVPDPASLRPGGYVSGPSQFSMADCALWYLTFAAIGRVELMALTSELSIRFLRPAVGSVLWARAELDNAGRRNVIGTVKLWVDDRTDEFTAVAQGTYVLPKP